MRPGILAKIEKRFTVDVAKESDIDQIQIVFAEAWPDPMVQARFRQRFRHCYFANPFSQGMESIIVCRDGERIVGFTGMMNFELWYHNQALPATHAIDLAVLPAYQGLGIGCLLLNSVCERNVIAMEGNLNQAAQKLAERMGGREVSSCSALRRWVHLRDVLPQWEDSAFVVEENAVIDERFDKLWVTARESYPVIGIRDQATLKWRYATHPLREFAIYTLRSGQDLVAYVATTTERTKGNARKGILVDYLFAPLPDETISKFISFILGCLARKGVVCVDTFATYRKTVDLFQGLGFARKKLTPKFFVYANAMAEGKADLWIGQNCHLTFGDSDFFFT
jgi:GNAT superfamily N-acetyltransferase